MLVFCAQVNLAARHTQADNWRFLEMFFVGAGIDEGLEQLAMQVAEVLRRAEASLVLVVLQQHHAEVIVAHIRGEVIPHDAFRTLAGLLVDDVGLEDLDQRQASAAGLAVDAHLDRDDLELDRVTIALGVVPVRQSIEAVVHHRERIAQVLLTAFTAGQIGKVGGNARAVRWLIVFIETNALEMEAEFLVHCDLRPDSCPCRKLRASNRCGCYGRQSMK
ncbi:MAG: hypothetical protein GAK34_02112 [Delftia tsuruhatensis]|nr:MAG: hypothetical protein GAK34_02112 [Delftia tsuruhatensis]